MTLLQTEIIRVKADTPFVVDELIQDLFQGKECLEIFTLKKGTFITLDPFSSKETPFALRNHDRVSVSCSAGFCRSQTLWALLTPFATQIVLLPPHACRAGFDPYNNKVNWHRNDHEECKPDEFETWFNAPKATRFGFQEFEKYKSLHEADSKILEEITAYYNTHYFGLKSIPENQKNNRRVYITFEVNAHVLLKRLIETNDSLENVTVIHIDSKDFVSNPLKEWSTTSRSKKSYSEFAKLLNPLFDFSNLVVDNCGH